MSLCAITLRNLCKRVKIRGVVVVRGVEDYEPSYKGLKQLEKRFLQATIRITNLPIRATSSQQNGGFFLPHLPPIPPKVLSFTAR